MALNGNYSALARRLGQAPGTRRLPQFPAGAGDYSQQLVEMENERRMAQARAAATAAGQQPPLTASAAAAALAAKQGEAGGVVSPSGNLAGYTNPATGNPYTDGRPAGPGAPPTNHTGPQGPPVQAPTSSPYGPYGEPLGADTAGLLGGVSRGGPAFGTPAPGLGPSYGGQSQIYTGLQSPGGMPIATIDTGNPGMNQAEVQAGYAVNPNYSGLLPNYAPGYQPSTMQDYAVQNLTGLTPGATYMSYQLSPGVSPQTLQQLGITVIPGTPPA